MVQVLAAVEYDFVGWYLQVGSSAAAVVSQGEFLYGAEVSQGESLHGAEDHED